MSITPLPTPPNRTDAPALFTARANAFVDALADMVAEFNAVLPVLQINRQNFTPVAGGTTTIAASTAGTIEVYLNHAASVAGQTIVFPAPVNGQRFLLLWREAVTGLTLSVPTGSFVGGITSAGAAARTGWVYNATTGLWHRYT